MAPLRFRAWHKSEKRMEEVPDGNSWGWFGDCVMEPNEYDEPEEREWIVMQSTGFKDRNGKEIFEGDLLKMGPGWGEKPLLVEWGHVGCSCCSQGTGYIENYQEGVVIGNVYESPSLLQP